MEWNALHAHVKRLNHSLCFSVNAVWKSIKHELNFAYKLFHLFNVLWYFYVQNSMSTLCTKISKKLREPEQTNDNNRSDCRPNVN